MINIDKKATKVLRIAVQELPALIKNGKNWASYYIDAEEPIVERLWHKLDYTDEAGDWRVCLHHIQLSSEAFYHPHRHPTAILICNGCYEMGVGYGLPDGEPPPIFGPILLKKWDYYQMAHPNNWHYIKTLDGPCFSIMVTGEPYDKFRKITRPKPRVLNSDEVNRIFNFFTPDLIREAGEHLVYTVGDTKVNLGVN